jgi:hypothetical protein
MQVKVDVKGIKKLLASEPGRVDDWLNGFTEEMVTNIKTSMGTSPPGRSYERGTVTHVASKPGYPPNVDTGALRASIRQEKTGRLERTIYDGMEYGVYLENGVGMAPRPFMTPEFDAASRRFEADARRNLKLEW